MTLPAIAEEAALKYPKGHSCPKYPKYICGSLKCKKKTEQPFDFVIPRLRIIETLQFLSPYDVGYFGR